MAAEAPPAGVVDEETEEVILKHRANTLDGQIRIQYEIIVDSFAGGGGASTGIELATGKPVDAAINHDPAAVIMHKTNHRFTEHVQASVWDVDPTELCRGRPVGLLWASPDCKHFSKAKGAALVDRHIRGLAWIVLRWAGTVRPRVIILENVEEFVTWGPVRKGRPVKKLAGTTFQRWKQQLVNLGYEVDHRELVAADYGTPTTRKRFYLIARCDGQPIVWPKRTHAPRDSEEVKAGKLLPWRSAAEIIDWSIPGYSVFASKAEIKEKYGVNAVRPLAENTMRRIIRGVDKFTIRSGKPFIVPTGYGERNGQSPRVHDIESPLPTVVATGKENLCRPVLTAASVMSIGQTGGGDRIRDVRDPAPTCVSKQEACLVAANLIQYHTEQTENVRANGLRAPIPTVDASNRYGLTAVNLVEYFGTGKPLNVEDPLHTVTSHDREGVVAAHIVEFKGQDIGQEPRRPLRTITASWGEFGACHACLTKADGGDLGHWPEIRALLNRHCGYHLAEDEVILLEISGALYFLSDITLRMLIPRELYNAMGFPPDYIIDRDYTGKPYGKSEQVARCGNAVCPQMATALVRANLPEWCGQPALTTMKDFEEAVTA